MQNFASLLANCAYLYDRPNRKFVFFQQLSINLNSDQSSSSEICWAAFMAPFIHLNFTRIPMFSQLFPMMRYKGEKLERNLDPVGLCLRQNREIVFPEESSLHVAKISEV